MNPIKESDNKPDEKLDNESIEKKDKVSNKKSTKKLIKESDKKSVNKSNKNSLERLEEMFQEIDKESEKEFIEDLKEAIGLNNKSTTKWYDKNKFNKILTTIDSNNFNRKNKIGKLKFNGINYLIYNIKNNTISEADTKKKINKLNEIKNVETKGKRLIDSQKTFLSLFIDLKTIFNNNNNSNDNNNNNNNSNNSNNNESDSENEGVNENENKNESESENKSENESDG